MRKRRRSLAQRAGRLVVIGWNTDKPPHRLSWRTIPLAAASCLLAWPATADEVYQTPTVDVVGTTPVLGTGIDKDRLPVNVQTFSARDMRQGEPLGLNDVLSRRLGSVSSADYQGNELQPSLSFRGFTASPVLGEPQGLAVYQNGMRANEAFGDVVNWDLIPSFAVDRMQVLPGSNPVFGLNALGGAISLQMKNGFNTEGGSAEAAGGSFGRAKGLVEVSARTGNFGFYAGVQGLNDQGWRKYTPSRLLQSYTDLDWRGDATEIGVGITLAASYLGNNGATPREILDNSWSSAFTTPDNQRNGLAAIELRGSHDIGDSTSIQATGYFRHLRTAVENGNTSQFQDCGGELAGLLCNDNGRQLFDRNGGAIATPEGSIAQLNNTLTQSNSVGAALQVSHQSRLFGLDNAVVAGLSVDAGRTDYTATTFPGSFTSMRIAVANGPALGGSDYTKLRADNLYGGLYATDTLSLASNLDLTLAARYNAAEVRLQDRTGTALNGDHSFRRLNPSAGLAWKVLPDLTLFTNYSEANRVPTPAELSCADPNQPCRVPNAFAGDPGLKQVVSRSAEAGARGRIAWDGKDGANWSVAGFFSNNQDDIIFVTAPTQLTAGFFQNAGHTQRVGLETRIDGRRGGLSWYAGYTLLRATFESSFSINNPANPGADASGNIHVRPGNLMPGVPQHTFKAGASYDITSRWTFGGDLLASSGVFLRGDEANLQKKTAPYAVVGAETSYRVTDYATAYFRANNLFNTRYSTAGVYSDGSQFGYPATDRFLTPAAPFNFWGGMRFTF